MSFERPWILLVALIVAAILIGAFLRLRSRARGDAFVYSDLPFLTGAIADRSWLPRVLYALPIGALALLAVAAGGPRLIFPVPVHDGSVFICIDTSGSMQSTDVAPTRAAAAQAAARAFIEETPTGTRIGIIAFSSSAGVVAPLTADHAQAIAALEQIPSPNGATAIGDALRLAAQGLPESGHRAIVLITDGVNNTGIDPQEMAQWLGAHHVPVYTIGIGTNDGDVIPGTGEQATIDEGALQAYAQVSGGAYSRAQDAAQLRNALVHLGRITSIERKPVDATLAIAVLGACLLLVFVFAGVGAGRFP